MAQTSAVESRSAFDPGFGTTMSQARPGGLLARIYREIGLAAVANALEVPASDLDFELAEAIRRGERYLFLTPKIRLPKIRDLAW
jgi:hypothetical protein